MSEGICRTPLWDTNVTWDTTTPDFTPCFQKSILALIPCAFLFLMAPIRLYLLFRKRNQKIGWNWCNILKVVVTCVLIAFAAFECIFAGIEKGQGDDIAIIDIVSPLIVMFTMMLALFILGIERKKGVRSSGVLVLFWLLFLFCGFLRLISVIRQASREDDVPPSIFIHYPCLLFAFILNLFVDDPPQVGDGSEDQNPSPEKNSSFLSQITFWWFTSLIVQGYRRPLTQDDLWSLNNEDKTEYLAHKFYKKWNLTKEVNPSPVANGDILETSFIYKEGSAILAPYNPHLDESKTPKRSLFSALVRTYFWSFMMAAAFKFIYDCLVFLSPQLLKLLIQFVSSEEYTWRGYFYASLLLFIALVQSILLHQYFHATFLLGMRLRSTIISVIYRKTLRLSNAAKKTSTVGEIVNLMSVDAQRFMDLTTYLHMFWSGPFQISVALYFLWQTLGPSALAGIGVMILLIPINAVIAHLTRKYQIEQMVLKDARIKLMNEVLNGIKVLKLYAWEGSFQDKVLEIRNKELHVLKKAAYLNATSSFFWTCAPILVSLSTFAVYVMSSEDNILDAEKAFVSLALFNILRFPLSMVPNVITNMVQANVSLKRLQAFVDNTELDAECVEKDEFLKPSIKIENASFSWEEGNTTLSNIRLEAEEGSLVAVVGAVGAGKSSLLAAMLGEMDKISGTVSTRGSVSYVAQQAWIQNETLQNNILFNKPLDSSMYEEVVDACALRTDLSILPGGDQTEIGEKGINLSGGQKQRVSLARAVYQDTDVYLMDDPLSAVDSHVGKHLFDKVIGPNGMLKGKTRILVTHGIGFLPQVDKIVVLVNGCVSETGSFSELMSHNGAFADFLRNYLTEELEEGDGGVQDEEGLSRTGSEVMSIRDEILSQLGSQVDDSITLQKQVSIISDRLRTESEMSRGSNTSLNHTTSSPGLKRRNKVSDRMANGEEEKLLKEHEKKDDEKLVKVESVETGRVKMSVFLAYLRAVGPVLTALIIMFYVLYNGASIYSNIWLSQWSNDARNPNITKDEDNRNMRLGVYGALGLVQGIMVYITALMRMLGAVKATGMLHLGLLLNVLASPMSFFDTTPTGRIVNRFSKDVDTLDVIIPMIFGMFLMCFFNTLSTILVISFSTPLFLAVIVPLMVFYYFVQRFYVASSRQLKRLESVSRSPIYSHFGETITGAMTIRAFGQEALFIKESQDKVDLNQISYFPSIVSNRWLAIRLEFVGNFIIFFASLFAVIGRDHLSPGIVGLSITYAMNVTQTLNWMVRMTCELETNIVAVERIKEYTETQTEADWVIEGKRPSAEWPEKGVVKFKDYKVRYREGLDLVLKGIDCEIKSGEKIGIVGRTGAGKSSLTLALFRIIEAAGGSISVDGIDISTIGLHDLRSKLTIIPQDPVLFSGTLRMNLDPFENRTDEDIWSALEHAHLKTFVSGLAEGLLFECSEGGENLSVGQRQLVCLARALLRKTQVLILDEATAAVDLETDDLIQATIRTEFEHCTVLTIAHRLNTIMDYTRIMVLDAGTIHEFDSPQALLQDTSSVFHSMAKDAGLV
ncbi:multidrug resistance-associated protein 1 isoform X1 [Aplysia californica]|uniref:ABC-type glutathione-S-conjugate transporter n=1 Tax=Aplysia californica TaxID=6500 RepID=A0ABM0ZYU0_APLCA|nr:multidrug resistance-associated protein 1 isoform X1 [Aplysia californica]XP_012937346.1 multidrug resistance-associated protein 1 isoform X1 [Aplysia californica]XP_012937349.1 multidrug resistance-associated protein 1 isoform X1 [Aplysia californica]XP_012937350.1 multidrug resistance-associated protein 1 isoform X1 [Aplysia californica]XP_035825382.1 multidrug resistance-associated protein 1 isoform X1 [Aplysia californica]